MVTGIVLRVLKDVRRSNKVKSSLLYGLIPDTQLTLRIKIFVLQKNKELVNKKNNAGVQIKNTVQ